MTFSTMAFSLMTLNATTLGIMDLFATLGINGIKCRYAECCYDDSHILICGAYGLHYDTQYK